MTQTLQDNQVNPEPGRSSFLRACILPLLSMAMLWCSQEPLGWSICSWFALVPWLIAVVRNERYLQSAMVNLVCGTAYYIVSLLWLANVTAAGMAGLSVYLSLYFVLSGFILRRVYITTSWWFMLTLPLVWVAQEYLRATVMTGFPWLFISHTLIDHSNLVQIADISGAYGVTFLAVMVNGFIADLLLRSQFRYKPGTDKRVNLLLARFFVLLVIIVSVYCYGMYRNQESQRTMTAGPVVAVIQEAIPQYVKESGGSSIQEIIDRHIELTHQACSGAVKPELVVWPETMVLNAINDEFLALAENREMFVSEFQSDIDDSLVTDQALSSLAAQYNVALLIGTPGVLLDFNADKSELVNNGRTNSAIMYNPDGSRSGLRYDKMHRVPFGEYVPFKESIPWLNRLLLKFTPYGYDYSINAGVKPVKFSFPSSDGIECSFTVAICYEDVTPVAAGYLANWDNTDFMLNISNDGWFVNERAGKIEPTAELMQHLAISRYRAIEHRIGIARSVNCGVSAMVRPDGSVQSAPLSASLPASDIKARRCIAGYITDNVWLDGRKTVYSRVGDGFALGCTALTVLMAVMTLKRKSRLNNRGVQLTQN